MNKCLGISNFGSDFVYYEDKYDFLPLFVDVWGPRKPKNGHCPHHRAEMKIFIENGIDFGSVVYGSNQDGLLQMSEQQSRDDIEL